MRATCITVLQACAVALAAGAVGALLGGVPPVEAAPVTTVSATATSRVVPCVLESPP